MVYFIVLFITMGASLIGVICGIGGGIIIKPAIDALGIFDVAAANFLSGCAVLSMSVYSVVVSAVKKDYKISVRTALPLACGAAVGGVLGRTVFQYICGLFPSDELVGFIQAVVLATVTLFTLVYTLVKHRIRSYSVKNPISCVFIGTMLGVISSFLGIGGGPLNMVVLYFFFSMETKTAAANSLCVVLFSQLSSLIGNVVTGSVPEISLWVLLLAVVGGIGGSAAGKMINKRISSKTVDKLFVGLMCVIIIICVYNACRFML